MKRYDPTEGDTIWTLALARRGKTPVWGSPIELLEAFRDYEAWCKLHPIQVKEHIKSGMFAGSSYILDRKNPMFETDFCLFIGASSTYLSDRRAAYEANYKEFQNETSLAFMKIIDDIRSYIKTDMDRGAMSGCYDPGYTAKLRGLADRRDVTTDGKPLQTSLAVNLLTDTAVRDMKRLKTLKDAEKKRLDDKREEKKRAKEEKGE